MLRSTCLLRHNTVNLITLRTAVHSRPPVSSEQLCTAIGDTSEGNRMAGNATTKNEVSPDSPDAIGVARWRAWADTHPWLAAASVLGLVFAFVFFVVVAYWALNPTSAPGWTGFNTTRYPLYSGYLPAKNLWDWLQLLIIPIILALGAAILGRAQQNRELRARNFDRQQAEIARENEWALEQDRQEQLILEKYYDRMAALLLDKELAASDESDTILRSLARALTLSTLSVVNPHRRALVLRFLYDATLIYAPQPVVDLEGANLSGIELDHTDLKRASLTRTDLREARLKGANLRQADLSGATLIEAQLHEADLAAAKLEGALLSSAHLTRANLESAVLAAALLNNASASGATMRTADLTEVNLVGADLTQAALHGAVFSRAKMEPTRVSAEDKAEDAVRLDEALYDTATVWPEDFDLQGRGAVLDQGSE